ncbi:MULTISPECIES: hypothetical protein [Protofrankia]|uniref:hypothetical protein n=1 Tax=Protofrankia TaxID=2994361 RepID=UPI001ED91595|nr:MULTISPECIES: hypothetical protein [Protofrankia]
MEKTTDWPTRRTALTAQLRVLLSAPAQAGSLLFAASGPAAFAAPWRDAFEWVALCDALDDYDQADTDVARELVDSAASTLLRLTADVASRKMFRSVSS